MQTKIEPISDTLPFESSKPIPEMSLAELAEQLERVTSWIEAQRSQEREARAVYTAVKDRVDANVARIRAYAEQLYARHTEKATSYAGIIGRSTEPLDAPAPSAAFGGEARRAAAASRPAPFQLREPKNIADAILSIWSLEQYADALTTEEIADALKDVGYQSEAAPTSLKSSINQALAKLCRVGRIVRFRSDGSMISQRDRKSRARKYIAATRLPDGVTPE